MAQVHFVVRPPEGELIPDIDTHDLERRLTDAARSWRDDLTSAHQRRLRRGAGRPAGAHLPRRVPRGLQGGLRRAHGVGRRRPARGDRARPRRQRHRPVALRAGRRRPRRGPAQGLPDRVPALAVRRCCRCCPRWASRWSTSGPTSSQLDRPSYLYEFGLRYSGRGMPAHGRELFQDALRAVWDGHNEIDGFNALVLGAGPDLAAGDGAARLREVHEAGQHALRPRLHRGGAALQRRHHPAARAALRGPLRPRPRRARRRRGGADRADRRRSSTGSAARSTTSPASTTTGSCAPT